jgi:hypothetical protein
VMGPDTSQIVSSPDRRSRIISGGEVAWRIISESGPKSKPWFSVGATWRHQMHFGVKSGLPQTTSSCPQNLEKYKRAFVMYFIIISKDWTV